jgi:LysM repeat protein
MRKYIIILFLLLYTFIFSIDFSNSNKGYYEIPAYKTYNGFNINQEIFNNSLPLLIGNLEYNGEIYYLPYKKFLYNKNEVFILGAIERFDNFSDKNFKVYSTNEIIKKFEKEIQEANISILILYKNVSIHGEKVSQDSTNLNISDFTFVINDTYPREIYALNDSVFEKYYKDEVNKDNYIYYKVKNGDTLYSISRKFGVSIDYLTNINNIESPEVLKDGMYIIIGNSKNYYKGE